MTQQDPLEALKAADVLISRLQEKVGARLEAGNVDADAAFDEIVVELETAPEITTIRMALQEDPSRFGEKRPTSSASNTG